MQREREHGPFPHRGPDEGLLMGARNVEPVNGGGDWTVTKSDHWMFRGTGVRNGDSIPGLIGWEYHGQPAEIAGLEVVAGEQRGRVASTRSSGRRQFIRVRRGTLSSMRRRSGGLRPSVIRPGILCRGRITVVRMALMNGCRS